MSKKYGLITYQYLTLEMIDDAQRNAGFVDQKKFKTTDHYVFDSFNLQPTSLRVIQGYRKHVRPLLMPTCDFLLADQNGAQFSNPQRHLVNLCLMLLASISTQQDIDRLLRLRVPLGLDNEEQEWISEDQKHSYHVARICYERKTSRNVALKRQRCLKKTTWRRW